METYPQSAICDYYLLHYFFIITIIFSYTRHLESRALKAYTKTAGMTILELRIIANYNSYCYYYYFYLFLMPSVVKIPRLKAYSETNAGSG